MTAAQIRALSSRTFFIGLVVLGLYSWGERAFLFLLFKGKEKSVSWICLH